MGARNSGPTWNRRQAIGAAAATIALTGARALMAQEAAPAAASPAPPDAASEAFSFDILSERMQQLSREEYHAPPPPTGFLKDLDYDAYRMIQFDTNRARWQDPARTFKLHAYHLGWLFAEPVTLHEVVDGRAHPMVFGTEDFIYHDGLEEVVPHDIDLPGVAGFRLNAPLNSPVRDDEVVSFLGASYFRALGRDTLYGLSARGLAVNTATDRGEEFPRFTAFWLERPAPGAAGIVFHAALDSPSVTGAYRFVLTPGTVTRMDVTARLFFRTEVRQLGIAPLTSMYLFGPNDRGGFDDYRPRVHDSELLLLDTGTSTFVRPLINPPRLANSWLGAVSPRGFGLFQRNRDFADHLDAGAHYERRPSLYVEPLGDWGAGTVRLIEIPSDRETNDNIVAFWVPERQIAAGDALEMSYRLNWGLDPRPDPEFAQVIRTLVGHGGVSGLAPDETRQKFVVDFEGWPLRGLTEEAPPDADVVVANGTAEEIVLHRIEGTDIWRLVIEVSAEPGAVVELKAELAVGQRRLSETWLYQWIKE